MTVLALLACLLQTGHVNQPPDSSFLQREERRIKSCDRLTLRRCVIDQLVDEPSFSFPLNLLDDFLGLLQNQVG